LAVKYQKLLNLLAAFQNWRVKILSYYWMSDFSRVALRAFENRQWTILLDVKSGK
jgi:hypothetical protein